MDLFLQIRAQGYNNIRFTWASFQSLEFSHQRGILTEHTTWLDHYWGIQTQALWWRWESLGHAVQVREAEKNTGVLQPALYSEITFWKDFYNHE